MRRKFISVNPRSPLPKRRRDFGDWLDFNRAIKNFRTFRLQTDRTRHERRRGSAVEPLRVVQAHYDLAVDDVDAVAVETNQFVNVSLVVSVPKP